MLIFAGLEYDKAPERAAKLKALRDYFKEKSEHALNMLDSTGLSNAGGEHGDTLIVNSHGNQNRFAGMEAQAFFDLLVSKGLKKNSFKKVYLMACRSGLQAQDNSIKDNFARDFKSILTQNDFTSAVYAPRGLLSYTFHEEAKEGQTFYEIDEVYIESPERNYPLDQGLLLVL